MKHSYALLLAGASFLLIPGAQAQDVTTSGTQALQKEKVAGNSHVAAPPVELRGSNDECAGAVSMTVNATCVSTNGDWSSASESMAPITCNGFLNANANDLWYSFTATTSGTIVEVTGGPDTDPIVEVFSGSCGSLVSIGCADATLINETESANIPTNIGETYYYRTYWWDYGTAPTDYTFTTCVYEAPPAPPNDLCTSVVPEALNAGTPLIFTGDNTGATVTNDYEPGSALDGQGPSVFHAFTTSECASVVISYCGTTPAFGNVWIVLADACPANALIFNSSWNTGECPDGNVTIYYDSLAAGTYYLPVLLDPLNGAIGPYTITLTATSTPDDCVVGIDELSGGLDWSVFPNPGNGDFTIQYGDESGVVNIELLDLGGRVAFKEEVRLSNGQQHQLHLAGQLAQGAYTLRLSTNKGMSEQRLMVR